MADTINALPQFRHSVIALTEVNPKANRIQRDDIEIVALNKQEGNDFKTWAALWRHLRRLKPDVMHSYNLPTLEYQILGFLSRIPVRIHAEHGRYASDPLGLNPKYRLLRRLLNPFIHHWVGVSRDLSDWLETFIGIPSRKISLIYNGIDTDFFNPEKCSFSTNRLEGFASKDDIVVGTVGRMDPVKNQRILIDACKQIFETRPELRNRLKIAIVGDGPLQQELKQAISQHALDAQFWMPGARDDMVHILCDMDIFVLPSIAEGVPVTVLEAMAMRKPVVASAVGGLPEIIDDQSGILIKAESSLLLAEALIDLTDNMEKSREMGLQARRRALDHFSLSMMVKQYQQLYSRP